MAELLKIKDGEIVQRIFVTPRNSLQCDQMALRYLDKKKTKERPKDQRTWFFSDENGIPVSVGTASRAIQTEIDSLNNDRTAFEKEKADFEAWKASFKGPELTIQEVLVHGPKEYQESDEQIEYPKPKGRPKMTKTETNPFTIPNS